MSDIEEVFATAFELAKGDGIRHSKSQFKALVKKHLTMLLNNQLDSSGFSLIGFAFHHNRVRLVEFLVQQGFNVNIAGKHLPLVYAAKKSHWNTFIRLLEFGADIPLLLNSEDAATFNVTERAGVRVFVNIIDKRVEQCRKTLLLFIWWSRRTSLIHRNVAVDIIARKMLWPMRRVWTLILNPTIDAESLARFQIDQRFHL